MSVHLRLLSAAFTRRVGALRLAALSLLVALAQSCSAFVAAPLSGPDPSDPSVRVPAAHYRSTTGAYASQRPVEPRSWRDQNERVAPAPKQ